MEENEQFCFKNSIEKNESGISLLFSPRLIANTHGELRINKTALWHHLQARVKLISRCLVRLKDEDTRLAKINEETTSEIGKLISKNHHSSSI
jgi:hypothetical protein